MKKLKLGFTLIEVALFLVVTGALFIGVTIGVQNSIFQQRNNDAVQNFAEFLKGIYSNTSNVESEGDGRSEKAIYGKLMTFGEECNLVDVEEGNTHCNSSDESGKTNIFLYSVIGDIAEIETDGGLLETLRALNANVITRSDGDFKAVGLVESYVPRWAAEIQNTGDYENYKGALLVVRHPVSGRVYTFVMDNETIEVNKVIIEANNSKDNFATTDPNPLTSYLVPEKFEIKSANYCVNATGEKESSIRYDVRVLKNAKNTSGIEIMPLDKGNLCRIED